MSLNFYGSESLDHITPEFVESLLTEKPNDALAKYVKEIYKPEVNHVLRVVKANRQFELYMSSGEWTKYSRKQFAHENVIKLQDFIDQYLEYNKDKPDVFELMTKIKNQQMPAYFHALSTINSIELDYQV